MDPPTGGRFPRRAFGDRALIGVPRGLILGLQLDLGRKQPPAPGGPSLPAALSGQPGEQLVLGLPRGVAVGVNDADRDHQDFSSLSISIVWF